jgi:hypothetical protein
LKWIWSYASSGMVCVGKPSLIIRAVLRLHGVQVRLDDARALIVNLLGQDTLPAVQAARTIYDALQGEIVFVAFTADQRAAILAVLEDPPEGLAELRGALLRDQEQRVGS